MGVDDWIARRQGVPSEVFDLLRLLGCMGIAWESGLADAALAAQEKVKANNQCVGDLLAVIHGDGGHYLAEHGLEKACKDAEKEVVSLRMSVSALEESHRILIESEDPW